MTEKAQLSKISWWPRFIIAVLVSFGLFIGNMVRQAMSTDVDLVSKDYYQKELVYQDHMNQVKATQALDRQVLLNYAQAAEQVSIVFPAGVNPQELKGQVIFFRPSDSKKDFSMALHLNQDGQQHIRTTDLIKGLWRVQLNWKQAGKDYYLEKDITL